MTNEYQDVSLTLQENRRAYVHIAFVIGVLWSWLCCQQSIWWLLSIDDMPSIDYLTHSLTRSLARSFTHVYTHSLHLFIHSHIHPPINRIIHTFIHIYLPNHLHGHLFTNKKWHRSLLHSQFCIFPHPLTHSFNYTLDYSHIHSLIYSFPISHIH